MSGFPGGQKALTLKRATELGRGARDKGLPPGMKLGEDFPMVCEKCLGDNPFLRMQKLPNDAACKITNRPFNVFRWRPGKGRAFKKTIVCYEIAAEKNICQSCLVDMDFGLPVALRDAFMAAQKSKVLDGVSEVPISEANQAYYFQQKLANAGQSGAATRRDPTESLLMVAQEFIDTNEKEGIHADHEVDPKTGMLKRKKRSIAPPKDKSITTLFLSNLPEGFDEDQTKAVLQSYGDIVRVHMLREKNSAFLEFSSRSEAERAIYNVNGKVVVQGMKVRVGWAEKKVDERGIPVEPSKEEFEDDNDDEGAPEAKRIRVNEESGKEDAHRNTEMEDITSFDTHKLKKDLPDPPASLLKFMSSMVPPPGTFKLQKLGNIRYSYPAMTERALEGITLS
mmetsp:Transcript_9317/g.10744  ORF Transcript_9317/g.10744 Transcript_9317/m.10744 type:complete len:395 (+) Transcript_9317:191-1375(+)